MKLGCWGNTILSMADPHLTTEAGSGVQLSPSRVDTTSRVSNSSVGRCSLVVSDLAQTRLTGLTVAFQDGPAQVIVSLSTWQGGIFLSSMENYCYFTATVRGSERGGRKLMEGRDAPPLTGSCSSFSFSSHHR